MDLELERKIQVNIWLPKARWLYIFGLVILGILTNLVSRGEYGFPWDLMIILFVLGALINSILYYWALKIKESEKKSLLELKILIHIQLAFEIIVLISILHLAGTLESMVFIFLVLPIVSASVLFGPRGSIITSVIVSLSVWGLIYLEHEEIISHINRYGVTTIFYTNFSIVVTNALDIALFYIILGIFSGYVSKLLIAREELLKDKTNKLILEKEYRENELHQLDKTTKLLVRRDLELTSLNKKLDRRLKEQKMVEKSMLKAFSDLKIERKKVEDERNKTVAIINNFIDPIIVIDIYGKLNLFNPSAEQIFGIIKGDLGKKVVKEKNYSMENFKSIIKKDYKVRGNKELKSNDPNEEEVIIEFMGQELTYKVITAEVVDNYNKPLGIMKIFYNLTREKMIDQMKSEFISIAAHQLRTPLSAIKWVIKMLLDGDMGKLNDEQSKILFKGYRSNERIINLVNDMLNVSRIEEGRFGYSFGRENFEEALKIVIDNLDNQIKEKNLDLKIIKPKKIPLVYMDKQKMVLVLQNLIENSVKYTPENGKIEVSLEPGKRFVNVSVKDSGVGVPEKDQIKLFTKFFRAENVIKMQTEGSGLGLFMVKNIIEKHGGDISVKSKEGEGTEMNFTLPLNAERENELKDKNI